MTIGPETIVALLECIRDPRGWLRPAMELVHPDDPRAALIPRASSEADLALFRLDTDSTQPTDPEQKS